MQTLYDQSSVTKMVTALA